MNQEVSNRFSKIIKRIFCVVTFVLVVLVAIYPFDNASIKIDIVYENPINGKLCAGWEEHEENIVEEQIKDGEVSIILDNESLEYTTRFFIKTEDSSKQFEFYSFDISRNGLPLERLIGDQIRFNFNEAVSSSEDSKTIFFSSEFSEMLAEYSASLLYERIILNILLIIIAAVLCSFVNGVLIGVLKNGGSYITDMIHSALTTIRRFVLDIKEYAYFSFYSARTDLKAEVANSYLNWVWWVLEPLFNMLVYYFVFGGIFGNDQPYFIIFIYSALLMWNFFNKTITYSIKLVRANKEIVTKVYIPKYILLISNMLLNGLKLLISLGILAVMMIIYQVPVDYHLIYFVVAYIAFFIFTFGCGMILLHYGVFIDDLSYAMAILLNMLFFLSGVFYDVETSIVAPWGYLLKIFNPVAMYIDAMRNALLYKITPDFLVFGAWTVVSVILCCIGVHIVYKYENSYVKVV